MRDAVSFYIYLNFCYFMLRVKIESLHSDQIKLGSLHKHEFKMAMSWQAEFCLHLEIAVLEPKDELNITEEEAMKVLCAL